jgi:hypothetical protein
VSLKVLISTLLSKATDANHDNISFTGVNTSSSSQGATLFANSTYVFYLPTNNNSDTFTYNLSDGHGGTATGTVFVNMAGSQPGGTSGSISVSEGVATVKMFGIPGFQYDVQRATSLNGPWTTLTSAPPLNATPPFTATADGSFSFTDNFNDLGGPPGSAYYRSLAH